MIMDVESFSDELKEIEEIILVVSNWPFLSFQWQQLLPCVRVKRPNFATS